MQTPTLPWYDTFAVAVIEQHCLAHGHLWGISAQRTWELHVSEYARWVLLQTVKSMGVDRMVELQRAVPPRPEYVELMLEKGRTSHRTTDDADIKTAASLLEVVMRHVEPPFRLP